MYTFKAVIFDLDGVITKTAILHQEAWKKTFDDYLRSKAEGEGFSFKEFTQEDYLTYVDGKPRYNGVKSFLESRGITLEWGSPSDDENKETICGLGNRKNKIFCELLRIRKPEVYLSTVEFIKELKKKGIRIGVASSSKNCKYILEAADILSLFETRVDGVVSAELNLKGKPEGDIFVQAAYNLESLPKDAVVVEDAASGVEAGRNGGFGLVVGIARHNNEEELFSHYADVVVNDLSQLDIKHLEDWFLRRPPYMFNVWSDDSYLKGWFHKYQREEGIKVNPHYVKCAEKLIFRKKNLVFFLDYDGTLTPIVEKPELAVLDKDMRRVLEELASAYRVSVVSGRLRNDVENLVGIKNIFYAGSHGFDIEGPSFSMIHPEAKEKIPMISHIVKVIKERLNSIEGVIIEDKKFSVAVHYRLVKSEEDIYAIRNCVYGVLGSDTSFRIMEGKKVFEILPAIQWNKGKAVRWIMQALGISWGDATVIYIGDDTTDEDAFRTIRGRGVGILVSEKDKVSCADFRVSSPVEVKRLFRVALDHIRK